MVGPKVTNSAEVVGPCVGLWVGPSINDNILVVPYPKAVGDPCTKTYLTQKSIKTEKKVLSKIVHLTNSLPILFHHWGYGSDVPLGDIVNNTLLPTNNQHCSRFYWYSSSCGMSNIVMTLILLIWAITLKGFYACNTVGCPFALWLIRIRYHSMFRSKWVSPIFGQTTWFILRRHIDGQFQFI